MKHAKEESMKFAGIAALVGISLLMAACGSSPQNINGNWNAVLVNPDQSTAFGFVTNLNQSRSTVNVSNFSFENFGTLSQCFANPTGQSATFNSGASTMTITTLFPTSQNVLTLTGTDKNGAITGTWSLTGLTGCGGSGAFTMNGPPSV
jgi:hypothetical protein